MSGFFGVEVWGNLFFRGKRRYFFIDLSPGFLLRIVIQRVKSAEVSVRGSKLSSIGKGFLVLVGIAQGDTAEDVRHAARKTAALRIMDDKNGKMNLDIIQTGGEVLSVSQFTLLADTRKGNRPGFSGAATPEHAMELWLVFNEELRRAGITVEEGAFGEEMEVALVNDGPVTLVMGSAPFEGS